MPTLGFASVNLRDGAVSGKREGDRLALKYRATDYEAVCGSV